MKKNKQNKSQKSTQPQPPARTTTYEKSKPWVDFDRIESWLKARKWLIAGSIIAISLMFRLIYFNQAKDSLIMEYHRWEQSDMFFFDAWSQKIAAGDWLNEAAPHPYHAWHKEVIARYFKTYPQDSLEYARIAATDSTLTPEKAVIQHWYGGKTFHQEPLYTYLTALTYKVFGAQPIYVFLWQLLLGIAINLLIFLLAARYTNHTTALVAGLLAAFCGPMLCYDMALLRTTLTAFVFLFALWTFEKALAKPSPTMYALSGASMALAVLTQSYAILFFALCLVLLSWKLRKTAQILPALGMVLLGFLVVLSPVIYRNIMVGANPLSLASIGGPAFIVANVKGTDPFLAFMIEEAQFVRIMHQTQGAMMDTIFASIGSYDSFWDFIVFQFNKLRTIFFWYEMPNNMNFYLYREFAPVLKYLPVNHFIIAPLSLVGLVLWVKERRKQCLPWLALWLVAMVPLLFGTALSRYRIGFMAASIIPAAYAIVFIIQTLSSPGLLKKVVLLAAVGLAFFLTTNAIPKKVMKTAYQDYVQMYELFVKDDIIRLKEEKRYAECLEVYNRFFFYEPDFIKQIGPLRKIRNWDERKTADMFMNLHRNRGSVFRELGQKTESEQDFKRAEVLQKTIEAFRSGTGE